MKRSPPPFDLVAAADEKLGIGKAGGLPWRLPGEMRYFRRLTRDAGADEGDPGRQNVVIMGRRTWESVPEPYQPLSGRANVVITRQAEYSVPASVDRARDLDEALDVAAERAGGRRVFVIGGAELYRQAIAHPSCQGLYLTRIMADYDCDTFFPEVDETRFEIAEILDDVREGGVRYRIERWRALS